MFDVETVALIARAPALEGLDLAALPQRLTEAYASIVATRMRLRAAGRAGQLPEQIERTVKEMRRLAFTHEAFVSALPRREDRVAAAFVAGSAHHVTLLADRLSADVGRRTELTLEAISPEVSATLLFLIAEASADAAEMAKVIIADQGDDPVEAALLRATKHLASGNLDGVLAGEVPNPAQFLATDRTIQGVRALYYLILLGVRQLASNMLGRDGEAANPVATFDQLKTLCVGESPLEFDQGRVVPTSVFPGPLHMASLLSAVAQNLAPSAVVNLPAPGAVDGGRWLRMMQGIARRRPYLWRNHRQAIEAGYLEPGVSAVVSFPTGAGKSTLAELKIGSALLRGQSVVFLAPTLALVDQTHKTLVTTFPDAEVERETAADLELAFDAEVLPTIAVMTPERCLTLLSLHREVFENVGLLVFDECHLLHPRQSDRSRRAIDAMLCVLNFAIVNPGADMLLLSAMMSNTEEISNWVQELTTRRCIPLTLTWKPTRQVRGCVVYDAADITALNARLTRSRAEVPNKNAPAALLRELLVRPFGLFCLRQTWRTAARGDYALLPLLDHQVLLATGTARDRHWYLTPNGNQVAAALASAAGAQRLKTLVFTQTIVLANSAVATINEALQPPRCQLTNQEAHLYAMAVDELGGNDHVYLSVAANNELGASSACHHALLLPVERHLHESLFKRTDGLNVLVATSTLAQGMNLPSEIVIIGGDSRFDTDANRMEQLEAFELLNAAGRAGRAGESSTGFVLVVPSKVIHFDNAAGRIHQHWTDLRGVFSQSDQCLMIDDPMTGLLDEIHSAVGPPSAIAQYLVRRLPVGDRQNEDGIDDEARNLLGRSLAAFRARVRGDEAWINTRIEAVLAVRRADPEAPEALTWADRLAATAGVEVGFLRALGDSLEDVGPGPEATMLDWRDWMVQWLTADPQLLPSFVRSESLESLFGAGYTRLEDNESRGRHALPQLIRLLELWMAGDSLADLERAFGTPERRIGKAEKARAFVLKVIPELAYLFGLAGYVVRALAFEEGDALDYSASRDSLGACVREGFDRPEKLALRQIRRANTSRRAVHREFLDIERHLAAGEEQESRASLIRRVEAAMAAAGRNG